MQPSLFPKYRSRVHGLSEHLTLRNVRTNRLEANFGIFLIAQNAINTGCFPILTSADHLVEVWLPQHAIKITRKIPTVKFLNPPDAEFHRNIPSRSLSSREIVPSSYSRSRIIPHPCLRCANIDRKESRLKNRRKRSRKIVGSKRRRILREFSRPITTDGRHISLLYLTTMRLSQALPARILDTRSIRGRSFNVARVHGDRWWVSLACSRASRRITINFHRTVQKPISVSHTEMKTAIRGFT